MVKFITEKANNIFVMIEVESKFQINKPIDVVVKYFSEPKNILKFVPYFDELYQIDESTYRFKLKWLMTLNLIAKKVCRKMEKDYEIIYEINKESKPRIHSQLYNFIAPINEGSEILIKYIYEGPFESYVKREASIFMKKFEERAFEEISSFERTLTNIPLEITVNKPTLNGYIILKVGVISKNEEIDILLDFAEVESINGITELILSDSKNIVKIKFENGTVKETYGDIDKLTGNINYMIKKKK